MNGVWCSLMANVLVMSSTKCIIYYHPSVLFEPLGSDQPKKNGVCHCILGKIYSIIH